MHCCEVHALGHALGVICAAHMQNIDQACSETLIQEKLARSLLSLACVHAGSS